MTKPISAVVASLCTLGLLSGCAILGNPMSNNPVVTQTTPGGKPAGWKLVWADEFDDAKGTGLPDPAKWTYEISHNKQGWFNNELQYCANARRENSRIENGRLIIQARKEKLSQEADYGGQNYTSARLSTRGKGEWTYGFIETRAKLPCGVGTWPAIWMLGTSNDPWPLLGEIDIMEHVGRAKGEVLATVHTGAYNHVIHTQKGAAIMLSDVCDAFHNYQLTWTADQIQIGVDDKIYFSFANAKDGDKAKWPFGAPEYLLLNLAIGGQLAGRVDDAIFPVQMEVDYVRVYQPQP